MPFIIFLLVIGGVLLFYVFTTYNRFVRTKTRIKASVQEIGNQLKRQANLIPNLVESVKGYMKHEKDIFSELTKARQAVAQAVDKPDTQKMLDAGERLQRAISPIRAVFESTPELKAAEPTVKLMDELRDTADKLMYSRRTLIDLSADYNTMIVTVPSKFIAQIFGFKEEAGLKTPETGDHIEVAAEEMVEPKVKL
jgi:LemA protein